MSYWHKPNVWRDEDGPWPYEPYEGYRPQDDPRYNNDDCTVCVATLGYGPPECGQCEEERDRLKT